MRTRVILVFGNAASARRDRAANAAGAAASDFRNDLRCMSESYRKTKNSDGLTTSIRDLTPGCRPDFCRLAAGDSPWLMTPRLPRPLRPLDDLQERLRRVAQHPPRRKDQPDLALDG